MRPRRCWPSASEHPAAAVSFRTGKPVQRLTNEFASPPIVRSAFIAMEQTMPDLAAANHLLRSVFGLVSFPDGGFLAGRNVLAVMPTGDGTSLYYPALSFRCGLRRASRRRVLGVVALVRLMVADDATRSSAEDTVVTGKMTCSAPDQGPLNASFGIGGRRDCEK
jgi:hypothetical protein